MISVTLLNMCGYEVMNKWKRNFKYEYKYKI